MSKLNPTTLSEDTFEAVPAENLYYNTVAATSDESAAPYDQVPPAVVCNEFSEKETFATLKLEGNSNKENDQDKCKRATHMFTSLFYSPHYCSYCISRSCCYRI